ncbi:guanylate kinase [Micromonospora orduensis]|uniref:guanylate kinase n=1 Tax=Micromonospora orduensis TaxID=1420891 RepID=UPI00382C846B
MTDVRSDPENDPPVLGAQPMARSQPPLLFVVAGPSGAGKTSAIAEACHRGLGARLATYTTRPPRPSETDGVDYHFVSRAEFERLKETGEIAESQTKYGGHLYGSPRISELSDGTTPLFVELDPPGFLQVRSIAALRVVGVFIIGSSQAVINARVRRRDSSAPDNDRANDQEGLAFWARSFDYVLLNDKIEQFLDEFCAIVRSELLRRRGLELVTKLMPGSPSESWYSDSTSEGGRYGQS